VNVHRWPILITSLLLLTNLGGCASFSLFDEPPKPITITTVPAEKTPLAIPDPSPLKSKPIRWVIITPANAESVWQRLEQDDEDVVVFALTADGYQQLAVTIAELRNLIATQRVIIQKYREYYEPAKPTAKEPVK
jgi:hypothetical protein